MTDLLRQEITTAAETIVIKIGTRVLTEPSGKLDEPQIASLAEQVQRIQQSGRRVVLVSSGAVGAGMERLGLETRPVDVARLQAVAAVGQTRLIEAYDRIFRQQGHHAAQVLLTADDFHDRGRYLNVRNTLLSLLELGAIPVINENDTVSVDELMTTFGDNDRLAALVTNLLRAPLLIILSDVEGLYDRDPRLPGARLLPTVQEIDDSVFNYAQPGASGLSRGGMTSKLRAAKMVTMAGENVIIASGRRPAVLDEIMAGAPVGSLFMAHGKTVSPWKRWIGYSVRPQGQLILDAGACRAIVQEGRSLLAIGVVASQGQFSKGDAVSLCDPAGRELARGLTNYSAEELERIRGHRSDEIAQLLGHRPYVEVVHRDNLAVVAPLSEST